MKPHLSILRNTLLLTAASMLIAGCSVRLQNYVEIVSELASSPEDVNLTQQEIEEFPYAGSYIQVTERPRAFMALAFDDNGVLKWRTGGDEIIHTRNGRIIGSTNMSGAIAHTSNVNEDPLSCFQQSIKTDRNPDQCATTWQRSVWVTTATPEHFSDSLHTYTSEFKQLETTQLTLASSKTFTAIKIEEVSEQFTNTFYIDQTSGRIVKSHQLIAPPQVYATIEEVKPYVNDMVTAQ